VTTLYNLLRERCGLSQREAADFHGVRPDTVKSWCTGRNRAPDGVIAELRTLYRKIERAADNLASLVEDRIEQSGPEGEIEIGYAADDKEARALGWPCGGAQLASIGIACAKLGLRVKIVPRGSTAATARAADIHDKYL
jgi:hypothetical protein